MPAINPESKLPACTWITAAAASIEHEAPLEKLLAVMELTLEAHHDNNALTQPSTDGSSYASLQSCLR
jgi:hypothetical protein